MDSKNRISTDGSALLIAQLFVFLLTMGTLTYLSFVISGSTGTWDIGRQAKAFYAAEAGVQRLLYELNNGGGNSVNGTLTTDTYSGTFTATYDLNAATITSTGTVGTNSRTIVVRTRLIPSCVGGAATTNCNVSTLGNITIDGRDYDNVGNLTGGPGVYGISSAGTVSQGGSSTIGGNGNAPAMPAASSAIKQNAGALPSTQPWDLLGVSEGWFNANVTVSTEEPEDDFSGITYYDPPGGTWNPADLGNYSGILIVHNATNTAKMKNVHGTFKGLIITDEVQSINAGTNISGAFIVTGTTANTLGNGTASLVFSSKTLDGLKTLIGNQTSGWKKIISAGSWQDQN